MHDTMLKRLTMRRWYKLTFKQIQPIHIGYRKHGVISETRIFITGQVMWGALTNAYYRKTGKYDKDMFQHVTCFYPKLGRDRSVLRPKFKDGEFYLGYFSERNFRQKFTTTLLSTAINPELKSAKDESLHELDVILPGCEKYTLYWEGYVWCNKDELKKIEEIYVGGDSRYGLGLMKKEAIKEENYPYNVKKGVYDDLKEKGKPIDNFVKFDKSKKFEGKLELLAEFSFHDEANENQSKSFEGLYISVGSKLK